jgi:proline iminopeptidase
MRILYPPIKTNHHFMLPVGNGHEIYVEECGDPEGVPVVFLHGGPGAGCEAYHRRFFDPEKYRIILFDQRGCGRSMPHAELENNTTQDLIADMEQIRKKLGIHRWVVLGGSWGSTLALAYAEAYPERVFGLILRGIFLCTHEELQWFYQRGASRIFPDYWQDFLAPIPESERDNLLHAYHKRLTGENEIARMGAAKAWSTWEGRTATLSPNELLLNHFTDPFNALSIARIETHYFMHNGFFAENQLLNNADKLKNIPGFIIHGRYDMICPLENAYALHQVWTESNLQIIAESGHAASETGIISALVDATDGMLDILE